MPLTTSRWRIVTAFLAAASAVVVVAGCGGGSSEDGDAAAEPTTSAAVQTEESDGVLPEIVAATQEVIAHLESEGAVPDEEARARVGDGFDASQRLRFPPAGPNCGIRAVAAGSTRLVEFTQRAPIYDEVVTDPDEDVAVALDLPTVDPDAPASVRCIQAVTSALATLEGGATRTTPGERSTPAPAERPMIEVRGSGVTTTRGGFFTGALVENTGSEDLAGVDIGFDVVNVAGDVIGSGHPARVAVLPAGATVAAASNTTEFECKCEADEIARLRTRFQASAEIDEAREPATVTDSRISTVAGDLVISGTIENPGSRRLEDPTISYVALDANGVVMSGNVALLDVLVPEDGSAPFEATPPASFVESLPRRATEVQVAVDD